jgi:hypothetical protein
MYKRGILDYAFMMHDEPPRILSKLGKSVLVLHILIVLVYPSFIISRPAKIYVRTAKVTISLSLTLLLFQRSCIK